MQIQLIRNATLRVHYAGHLFIIDPYLAPKHSLRSLRGISPNPMVDLPMTPEAVVEGAEMVLVSHLHTDHFDAVAWDTLPKSTPILCQPGNEEVIRSKGFSDVTPVADTLSWKGISFTRTPGNHGSSEKVLADMGTVSGFVIQADSEPTVYWVGDSVWYPPVAEVIAKYQPDVIVTHSCGAVWNENELIVMDAAQTVAVCQAAPESIVVAVHMETLDHSTVSRAALRQHALEAGIALNCLLIPADGEAVHFVR